MDYVLSNSMQQTSAWERNRHLLGRETDINVSYMTGHIHVQTEPQHAAEMFLPNLEMCGLAAQEPSV